MYGLEALNIDNAQRNRLAYAYNSVFYKLFRSFNNNVILQTQYYTGHLNLDCFVDRRTLIFLYNLRIDTGPSPAAHLFNAYGMNEWSIIASKYNIIDNDASDQVTAKIWATFGNIIGVLP